MALIDRVKRFLRHPFGAHDRRARLEGDLAVFQIGLARYRAETPDATWLLAAEQCAKSVQRAIDDLELDTGWVLMHAAERHEIDGLDAGDLLARQDALLKEAASKLSDWRRENVLSILGPAPKGGAKPPALTPAQVTALRKNLKEALRVRDEHFANVYRKGNIRRDLIAATAIILTGTIGLIYSFAQENPAGFLGDPATVELVLAFGFFGGLISTAVSLVDNKNASKRMPEHIASVHVTLARPFFGAGFALAILLIMKSGIVQIFENKAGALALAAFLAGFSERWFLGIVAGPLGSQKSS